MLGNSADAADLTQDVFLQILRKLDTFRGESAFSTWLYRVAINLCKDHLRRQQTTFPLTVNLPDGSGPGALEAAPDAESAVENLELRMAIQQALSSLEDEFRLVVVLHDLQGYRYKKIAEMLDISIGTVKSRLNRARHKLAEKLLREGTIEDIESSKL